MPDKPSRRKRRRVTERTGHRPERRPQAAQPDAAGPSQTTTPPSPVPRPRTVAPRPAPSPSVSPAPRTANLAPSAARTAAYLQERQKEIVRELRGLGVTWAIVLALFVSILTLLSLL